MAITYPAWDVAKALNPPVAFDDLKASLAFVFEQRNRFVHEFSEMIAAEIGAPHDNERPTVPLRHVLLLLRFVQWLKTSHYAKGYSEASPTRGKIGKQLNILSAKIQGQLDEIETLVRKRKGLTLAFPKLSRSGERLPPSAMLTTIT